MYIVFLLPIIKGVYFLLLMLQQEHYNCKCLIRYFKKYYFCLPFIFCCYLSVFFVFDNSYLDLFIYVFVFVFSLIKNKYLIKLKITKRMFRLLLICLILCVIPFLFSFNRVTFLLVIFGLPFIVWLASVIISPFERLIQNHYKKQAMKKLNKVKPYVVCITGSYGKTSIKKMLESIYKNKYLVYATPKSFNTPMGIAKSINSMNCMCELFFCEAGATRKGDIKEIADMISPDVGVITSIGYQHMTTFKSIDNVLKTKWELADAVKSDGGLVLNYKNEYLNGLIAKNVLSCVGVNRFNSKYYACNIYYDDIWTEFDIYSFNKFVVHIKTKLLGEHNIDNIVMCYGVKKILDKRFYLSDEEFVNGVLALTNVENRLSIRIEEDEGVRFRFVDDSFNSNTEGFVSAVKSLKRLKGIKCIITPGIVDGGKYSSVIADKIVNSFLDLDDIVLVNNKELKRLKVLLNKRGIKYQCVSSFIEGVNYIKSKYLLFKSEYINILIENDLPDNYLMR